MTRWEAPKRHQQCEPRPAHQTIMDEQSMDARNAVSSPAGRGGGTFSSITVISTAPEEPPKPIGKRTTPTVLEAPPMP